MTRRILLAALLALAAAFPSVAQTITPQGRLTLTTGVPVMTADVTAATTVYYACYAGNVVPVGAGGPTNLTIGSCQISMGLDAGVPRVASGSVYDIFGVNNGGTLVMCVGPAWSAGGGSTTARGTGAGSTALTQTNGGIWTNTNSLTNCWGGASGTTDYGTVNANAGTYLGSLYATANGQTAMQFAPAPAAGGTNNFLALYNAYNRVQIYSMSQDNTATWTTTNNTWHPANAAGAGSGLNNRITWLDGLGQSRAVASYSMSIVVPANGAGIIGVIFDATSGNPGGITALHYDQSNIDVSTVAGGNSIISLGLHYAQAMEARDSAGGTITFDPNATSTLMGGLTVFIPM